MGLLLNSKQVVNSLKEVAGRLSSRGKFEGGNRLENIMGNKLIIANKSVLLFVINEYTSPALFINILPHC